MTNVCPSTRPAPKFQWVPSSRFAIYESRTEATAITEDVAAIVVSMSGLEASGENHGR